MPSSNNRQTILAKTSDVSEYVKNSLSSETCRTFIAELVGTFFIMAIGNSAIAAYKLRNKPDNVDYMAINFCYGTGVLIGVSATYKISGAHLNPAVTTAMAAIRQFSWSKVWFYVIAQHLGGFLGSAVVYLTHFEAIDSMDPFRNANITGDIFATYPAKNLTIIGALIDQIMGTAFLLFAILSISKAIKAPDFVQPPLLTIIITGVCTATGYNCSAILNPARDFAPRLFTSLVGYGWEPFQPLGGHYWWVAGIAGPHLGGIIGAWLFVLTIDQDGLMKSTSIRENIQDSSVNLKDIKDKANIGSATPRISVE